MPDSNQKTSMVWAKGEEFQVGEIWMSPRGVIYKVTEVSGRQATLHKEGQGGGRKVRRWKDDNAGWHIYRSEK